MSPDARVVAARAGAPALDALAAAVRAAKAEDPMAPVLVVVPGPVPALHVRRALARRGGVVQVEVVPLGALAQRLAADPPPALGAREWDEAVRQALLDRPGVFEPVATHVSTVRKVALALRRLRAGRPGAVEAFGAGSVRRSDLAALLARAGGALGGRTDRDGLHALAAREATGAALAPTVLFALRPRRPGEAALVAALAARPGTTVVVPTVGEPALDGAAPDPGPPVLPDEVVVAPDAETEARLAVRAVLEAAAAERPVPFGAMAIVPLGGAVGRLRVAEALDRAGVPWSGPDTAPLAASPAGRVVTALLDLACGRLLREEVAALLAAAGPGTVARGGGRVTDRWVRLAAQANVVGGEHWEERLAQHRRAARLTDAERADLDALAAFVAELRGLVAAPAGGWATLAGWLLGLLDRFCAATDAVPAADPDPAAEARSRIVAAVAGLASLDEVRLEGRAAVPPDLATFRAAVLAELALPGAARGRVGRDVSLRPADQLVGAEVELLVVTGAVEGALPARRAEDPLLPDEEVAALDPGGTRAERQLAERVALLTAMASASRTVVLTHRAAHQSTRRPSPWLLGWAGRLAAREAGTTDQAGLLAAPALPAEELTPPDGSDPWRLVVPSFHAAVVEPDHPWTCPQDLRLRSLHAWTLAGRPALTHPAAATDPVLRRGLDLVAARAGRAFTRFDGYVGGGAVPSPAAATALETYLECPQRYFLARVLGVGTVEDVTDAATMDGLTKGSLVHDLLRAVVGDRLGLPADEPWGPAAVEQAAEAVERAVGGIGRAGRAGWGVQRELAMENVLAVVAEALARDDDERVEGRWSPQAVEVPFGRPGTDEPEVVVSTPSGRELRFAGRIDRLDVGWGAGGTKVRVLDYKTGRGTKQLDAARPDGDPVRLLQLSVYEEAARVLRPDARDVEASWFLVEADGGPRLLANGLTRERFLAALDLLVDAIGSGIYPCDTGPPVQATFRSCRHCPYDGVCPTDRALAQERKAEAPVLAPFRALRALASAADA